MLRIEVEEMNVKRIGIVSDTHGALPSAVLNLFSGQWTPKLMLKATTRQVAIAYDDEGVPTLEEVVPPTEIEQIGCSLILHGGDIGPQSVLDELSAICRTVAVMGNNDYGNFWTNEGVAKDFRVFDFEGVTIALQHRPADLRASLRERGSEHLSPAKPEPQLAVHGHTHVPDISVQGSHVELCPGSPNRARNGSGHIVALVDVVDGQLSMVTFIAPFAV